MVIKHFEVLKGTPSRFVFRIINIPGYNGKMFKLSGEALLTGKFWTREKSLKWCSESSLKAGATDIFEAEVDEAIKKRIIEYLKEDFPGVFDFTP